MVSLPSPGRKLEEGDRWSGIDPHTREVAGMKRLKWGEAKGRGGCPGEGGEQEGVRQCGGRKAASMRSYGVKERLGWVLRRQGSCR